MRQGAFILVHYHTAGLLRRAVEAILADARAGGLEAGIVVVDNGSTEAERTVLRELPVRILGQGQNSGYAGGLNLGITSTEAEFLFLMNPDVFVLPGCARALIDELEAGAAACGPRFYLDEDRQILMPPTEERTPAAELASAYADRGDAAARWARQRWRRHAHRHWLARTPIRSAWLSGALFAVRRSAFEQVGPFDEGFRLYYEEQDWLARLVKKGLSSVYVPAAEAIHLYNQSAVKEPAAVAWAAESAARYASKHYGRWLTGLMRVVRYGGEPRLTLPPDRGEIPPRLALRKIGRPESPVGWIEVSPLPKGFPAGAARVAEPVPDSWTFPSSMWDHMAPGRYFLTVCSSDGRELHRELFRRPEAEA